MERGKALIGGCAALALVAALFGPTAYGAGSTVDTAAIMVKGVSTRVLTDAKGMTLYYVSSDTPTTSSCTGGCAKIWPPLLSDAAPSSEGQLPGKLAIVKTANGSQVSYSGHLLYTYSGDTGPHQSNGNGVAGQWWVAKVDLKPGAAAGPTPAPKPSGYGNGGW